MISFVWSSKYPFIAGSGGSENYTAGQIRELMRRGIDCRILTLGHSANDGRQDFPDIRFKALKSQDELTELDDTIVFVTYPLNVKTKHQSYVILHCPPPGFGNDDTQYDPAGMSGKKMIATSRFAARMWSRYYARISLTIPVVSVVYPFAEPVFSKTPRPPAVGKPHILFAGRLTPDKGIYNLLAAMHLKPFRNMNYQLTVTSAGAHSEDGEIIRRMLDVHPKINLVPACRSPKDMAALMAAHDIVVMPTTDIWWKESFGIVAVEAQHAGCRVVASKAGGLTETNCGGTVFIKPDDPLSLSKGVAKAIKLGPLTAAERAYASSKFTIEKSTDALLRAIKYQLPRPPEVQPHTGTAPLSSLYPALSLSSVRSKQ